MSNLNNDQIYRYSRQLLLPEIGVQGQLKIRNSRVLVVGAGGLGAPSALYLAAAGVGTIGIVDYDTVELNNLHRQIIHSESSVGIPKVFSAEKSIRELNSEVKCICFNLPLTASNSREIIRSFDVVVDASDNVHTRYLLNDSCVLEKRPLVSGSALRFDGQLTVYNHSNGPCFRCIHPIPPPTETVKNCNDAGIVGCVTGVIGSMQAMEALKIICSLESLSGFLLIYNSLEPSFRKIKLRNRMPNCAVCGDTPSIHELIDYHAFCSSGIEDKSRNISILSDQERLSVEELIALGDDVTIIDVRDRVQYDICSIGNSINIPLDEIERENLKISLLKKPIVCLCRRGNASQLAVMKLREMGISARDLNGGLESWSQFYPSFPKY